MSRNVERKVRVADSPAGTLCGELDGAGNGDGDGVYGDGADSGHDGDGTFSDTSGKQKVTQE